MLCTLKKYKKPKKRKKQDFGLYFIFLFFIIKNAFFMIKNDLFFILGQHYLYHQSLKNSGINGYVNKTVLGKLLFLRATNPLLPEFFIL